MSTNAIYIFGFFIIICGVNCAKVTVEQMKQATEPIRKVCITKTKVGEDALSDLRSGVVQDKKELKCYVNCVLEMIQIIKKGKLQYDAVMRSVDTMLPDELKDDTRRAVNVCKDVSVGIKDFCESAATMLKCIFKENPNFFFP
ncbi:CLUMA_CG008109, isoform A [Clunio marinus]|uniref:CLUMA_CG008109, isoform A n=1 Tax=Clunio marinus TaxID=568069 RepID=A0A1J1I874_9DIPT|nr:CLUMA_CG008109, isoform A [Clunio marinus]